VLKLVELFLFFKVELICHFSAKLSLGL
jgi:hypothetical protein